MQNYLRRQTLKACILSLLELIALAGVFVFMKLDLLEKYLMDLLIALNAVFIIVNLFHLIIVISKISKSKQKSDVKAIDILGEEIDEVYKFGKIGIIVTDDSDRIIWTNDWMENSQALLIDKDIFAWQKELKRLVKKENKRENIELGIVETLPESVKITVNNSQYEVRCIKGTHVYILKDISELETIHKFSRDHSPAIGILTIDNYSDVASRSDDLSINTKMSQIHNLIAEYAKEFNLLIKKFRVDSYLVLCTHESYEKMLEDKFSIVQKIKNVESDDRQVLTASFGFSTGSDDYNKLSDMSNASLNFALSRGGDQAVVSVYGENYKFFGGKSEAKETVSNVEMRTISHSLEALVKNYQEIYIMGHKNADFDAIGGALGLYCFASRFDKKVKIIYDDDLVEKKTKDAFKKLFTKEEITNMTIAPEDAFKIKRNKSLLILVDVHGYDQFMSPEIVEKASAVAIIDHHRRSEKCYEKPVLSFIKPYASSASEIVTEMIRYSNSRIEVPEKVATMMLAGITLDTNHYRQKTGQTTYDASLVLKSYGADNDVCDSFFKEDYNEFALRTKILSNGFSPYYGIHVYVYDDNDPIDKTALAIVAQYGLGIKEVNATFVVGKIDTNKVGVSARSDGTVNCQVLLEKMNGGGHFAAAATQITGASVKEVVETLKEVLDQYLDEAKASPKMED